MTSRFGNEPDGQPARRRLLCGALMAAFTLLGGCTPPFHRTREGTWRPQPVRFQAISMWNGSRLKPLEESPDPARASSSLALPAGTYARGERAVDDPAETGRIGGKLVTTIPLPVTDFMIRRGQERFNIYCSPCHGRLGD